MFFPETLAPPDGRKTVVQDDSELAYWERVLHDCSTNRMLGWDTETDGLRYYRGDRIIGHCWGYDLDDGVGPRGLYLPIRHRTPDKMLDPGKVTQLAQGVLGDPTKQIVTQNGVFDLNFACADGIDVKATIHDTMIAAALLNENQSKDLESLVENYDVADNAFAAKKAVKATFQDECRRRGVLQRDAPGYAWIPVGILGPYGATDGMNTLGLGYKLLPMVYRHWADLYGWELRLLRVLQRAEFVGQPIDVPYLLEVNRYQNARRDQFAVEVNELAGREININSPDDVRELVYGSLGQPVEYWTSGGGKDSFDESKKQPSTGAIALMMMYRRTGSRIFQAILDFRDADKLAGTYTTTILKRVGDDGILHGKFEQVGARTGRLSSKEPNLQNMPSKAVAGIRRAFLVPEGCVRLFLDFSQVELRILAWVSQEQSMINAFIAGEDIHDDTSMRLFQTTDKSVRRIAKVINFGVAYGMSKYGVRDNLNKEAIEKDLPLISESQAAEYLDQWHRSRPRVDAHKNELVSMMLRHHPPSFTNAFGRTRRIQAVAAFGSMGRRGERQAVASEVQGTANELMKVSMVRVEEEILAPLRNIHGRRADLVGNIHDEMLIDVDRDIAYDVAVRAKAIMEDFPIFAPIPIVANAEWSATTWRDKVEIQIP